MIFLHKLMFFSGLDLNVEAQNLGFLRISAEGPYASRQARVFADHDLPATDYFSSLRCCPSRRTQGQGFFLPRSVLRNVLCATDLSGVSARHRNQFARTGTSALSHGLSLRDGFAQYIGQCERYAPLANLCRLRQTFDQHSPAGAIRSNKHR